MWFFFSYSYWHGTISSLKHLHEGGRIHARMYQTWWLSVAISTSSISPAEIQPRAYRHWLLIRSILTWEFQCHSRKSHSSTPGRLWMVYQQSLSIYSPYYPDHEGSSLNGRSHIAVLVSFGHLTVLDSGVLFWTGRMGDGNVGDLLCIPLETYDI